MFGPKGPKRRGGPTPRRPDETPRGGVDETVIVTPGAPRRSAVTTTSARGPAPPASSRRSRRAPAPRTRLVDLAADWLSSVLALAQVAELPDAAALRTRMLELKVRFEREAGEGAFSAQDIGDAVFALVAFLDETILNNRGAARDAWLTRPLQVELFGGNVAGEEFFDRLDVLRKAREERIEALEVYECCLAFGFAGRYRLSPPEKLSALLEDVERDVAAVRGAPSVALAPRSARNEERAGETGGNMPWWLPPAVFVPAVALVWLLVWLFASLGAGAAASAIRRMGGS